MIAKALTIGIAALALLAGAPGWAAEGREGLVQFEGQLLEPAEAAQREEQRYRRQRIAAPTEIALELNADQLRALRARRDLAASLTAILRVGDRVLVQRGNQQWRIWKRHSRLTNEFRQAADRLRKGVPKADEWAADPIVVVKPEVIGEDPLSDAAFALHARRNVFPHADLAMDQLPAQALAVKRTSEDGALTVLAFGANTLKVSTGKLTQAGQLAVVSVAPRNDPLNFTWTAPPKRILVIGDSAMPLLSPAADVVLLKNEKRVVRLTEVKNVTAMQRYSHGPDYKGWHQQRFAIGGPLGFQMDLARDEVGPHQTAGDYRRVWLLEFGGTAGNMATQRQIEIGYRVKSEDKDAQSKEFLRR